MKESSLRKATVSSESLSQELDLETKIEELMLKAKEVLPRELYLKLEQEYFDCANDAALSVVLSKLKKSINFREKEDSSQRRSFKEVSRIFFNNNLDPDRQEETLKLIRAIEESAADGRLETLGEGRTAVVFTRGNQQKVCFKMIFGDKKMYEEGNNVAEEASFLDVLSTLRVGKIRTPKPYYYKIDSTMHCLVMEAVEGVTLEQIEHGGYEIPQNFSVEKFFSDLRLYVKIMQEKYGIYHRDLHAGNIMVNLTTGEGFVIDFGLSSKDFKSAGEDAFIEKKPGRPIRRYLNDLDGLLAIEKRFKKLFN